MTPAFPIRADCCRLPRNDGDGLCPANMSDEELLCSPVDHFSRFLTYDGGVGVVYFAKACMFEAAMGRQSCSVMGPSISGVHIFPVNLVALLPPSLYVPPARYLLVFPVWP